MRNYAAETVRLGAALQAAGLLSPARIEAGGAGGRKAAIAGTLVVDRRKLRALPPDTLANFARRDWLELIYLHLASVGSGGRAADRRAADALREASPGALLS